jgi:hypothetical protein
MIRRYSRGLFQQYRSLADITPSLSHVRFAPKSGHQPMRRACPLSADFVAKVPREKQDRPSLKKIAYCRFPRWEQLSNATTT